MQDRLAVGHDIGAAGAECAARLVADPGHLVEAIGRDDGADCHLVSGERTGLVRADDRDRAQRLDRRQAPNDGVAPGHPPHADRERDGEDGRQALGDRRHREADHGHDMSAGSKPRANTPKRKVTAAMARITTVSRRAKTAIWRRSGVVSSGTSPSMALILPISVPAPVPTTTPAPWPDVTSVPENAMPTRRLAERPRASARPTSLPAPPRR